MDRKVCLITGANSEVVSVLIERLHSTHDLVLCWHNSCERISRYMTDSHVETIRCDLQHEKQCGLLMENLRKTYSHVDAVINCIGKNISTEEITEKIWDEVLAVNLKPAYFLSKYYWKYFFDEEKTKTGCMVHISSTAGIRALPSSPPYIAAKAGMVKLVEYWAKVMAPYVRVNSVAPGFVATVRHQTSAYDNIVRQIPMGRMASFAEIAQTVEFIMDCEYITAQTIVVDGGMIS